MAECRTKRSFLKDRHREEGFLLLGVLFLLVLLTLALATAAPKIATELRREKEQEAVRRGEQYQRAIGLYYRKFGHYPTNIKELLNSNGERFLRRRYLDPFTGKDDWTLIHPGQAQMTGMPGQPPSVAGVNTGMMGSSMMPGSSPLGGSSPMGNSSVFSATGGPGAGIGGGSSIGGSASPFSSSGFGSSSSATTGSESSGSLSNPGAGIGAGPILGVGLPVQHKAFKVIHGKDRYNQWQFIFDPAKQMLKAAGISSQTGGQNGTNPGGINSGFGNSNGMSGSSPFGGGNGFGNSGTGPGSGSGFGNSGFGSGSGSSGSFGGSSTGSSPNQPD